MTEHQEIAKTVLITGATSGIGAEVARQFVARGHVVYGTSRTPDRVPQPIDGVRYVKLDNADYETAKECVAEIGDIDILVNNAGESEAGALEDTPMVAIERLFTINVFGPIAITKAALPGMRERHTGTIVMVGSMLSSFPVAFRSNYAATKSALKGFAMALRREVEPFGVRVVMVEPGTIATGIGERRSIYIGTESPYRAEFEIFAESTSKNERKGLKTSLMAERIVEAALEAKPKPFYARGNRAPIVFLAKRLLPQQIILDVTARMHGLRKIRE